MTGYNYADAEGQRDYSNLVPHGTLAWAILRIKPHNLDMGIIEVPSRSSDARYLDVELTLEGGAHDRRKIFTRIGTGGSEKYINMGRSAVKAILEVGRGANPTTNPQGYVIQAAGQPPAPNYMELDGLKVAIKVKEEKGQTNPSGGQYPDKNDVAVWLSPIDPTTGKDFERLLLGDTEPKGNRPTASAAAPAAPAQPAWAQQAQAPAAAARTATPPAAQPTTPQSNGAAKPPWLA